MFARDEFRFESLEPTRMMTLRSVLEYVQARPFCIPMTSGKAFDVRRPEMIKVLKGYVLVF